MKHFYKLFSIILLLPLLSKAQSNYKPGYVVTLRGDTIKGFIDYREWDANPKSINFKKALTDKNINKYSVHEINYLNIDSLESFQRYSGPISTDPSDPNKVTAMEDSDRDTSFRMDTVFLKILEKGTRLALYYYKDEIKIRYFLAENPGYVPKELIFRINRFGTEDTYRKQLSAAATKFNEINDDMMLDISRSSYNSDIFDIVSRINHITRAEYKKTHYNGKSVSFFVGVAANINNTSTSSSSPFYTAGGRAYTSYLPAGIFGVNFLANPATGKLQLRIEISVGASKFSSMYNSKVYPYEPTEASYNETAFSLSPQIIYNFYNAQNFKVFGGVGVVFSKYNFSNPYLGSQNHDGSESDIEANNPYFFNTFDDTFIFKAGVQFTKNLAIFASYLSGVSSTRGGYFQLSSTCEQVGLNYIFR